MQRIIFFDIDGTLLPDGSSTIPDSALRAIRAARENGHLMYINTGRPQASVPDYILSPGFDGVIYGCGTHVVCGSETLLKYTPDPQVCQATIRLLRETDCVPMFESWDGVAFDFKCRQLPIVTDIRNSFRKAGRDVDRSDDEPGFVFDKFIVCYDELTDLPALRSGLEEHFFWIDRGPGFAAIVPKPYSKATGIELALKHHGLDKSQAYAIGDSLNDLPMFQAVGTSIAMGNGQDLIPYADYVTDDVTRDGIWKALAHFGLF